MIRYVNATPQGDAWNLEAQIAGEWKVINAGTQGSPVGGRFPKDATHWRLVDVWHNGRVVPNDPVPLADVKSLGPVRRRFSRDESAWLAEHGVDERTAATFPRGFSLADIKDALSE